MMHGAEGGGTGPTEDTVPGAGELAERARAVLADHWRDPGFTVPHASVYPHQWLWDSCFHAVTWAHLGEGDRALSELRCLFSHQAPDGFVPHLTYWGNPTEHLDLWGRERTSTLTQPPMYGHALAELARRGIRLDADLVHRALAGLRFLLTKRNRDGLVVILHPWESGCDDSPRWDAWFPGGHLAGEARKEVKGELVRALRLDPETGSPIGSDRFEVASAAFNALVLFNVDALATVTELPDDIAHAARRLRTATDRLWRTDFDGVTAVDLAFPGGTPKPSGSVHVLESLLLALTLAGGSPLEDAVFGELADPAAFWGPFGPAQVDRKEPTFDPRTYWRGPVWPQLNYLVWLAARRLGRHADANRLRDETVRGALRSGFAEHWHPDTGEGQGAVPQSWTAVVAVMATPPQPLRASTAQEPLPARDREGEPEVAAVEGTTAPADEPADPEEPVAPAAPSWTMAVSDDRVRELVEANEQRAARAATTANQSVASEVRYEVGDDGVATLTINRPDKRNSLTWTAITALRRHIADCHDDPRARVLVLTGAGDKAFCSGVDLSGMAAGAGALELHQARGELGSLFQELWELGKPTIAKVRGYALAGGMGLALACDLVVASDDAVFGTPEIDVGLWPHLITVPLTRSMAPKQALELMLTARRVPAEEGQRIGFVNRVVAADQLDDAVGELARSLASKSPAILRLGLESFHAVWDQSATDALRFLQGMLTITASTEDAAEGLAAFAEKRPPEWTGR